MKNTNTLDLLNTIDIQNNVPVLVVIWLSIIIGVGGYRFYVYYTHHTLLNRMLETTLERAEEGINSGVTLTPEDFRQNPELAEMLNITGVEEEININLETQEQVEFFEFQGGQLDTRDITEVLDDALMNLVEQGLNTQAIALETFTYINNSYATVSTIINNIFTSLF
jgi:hypothetical protein